MPGKPATSRGLFGAAGQSKTNDLGVRPLTSIKKPVKTTRQSVNPNCTARKTLFNAGPSTSRRTIKPITPKPPPARTAKSFFPKPNTFSTTKTLPNSEKKVAKPKIAQPSADNPKFPRQKLVALKRNLQSALEIVDSLMEFATDEEEKTVDQVSTETQTSFLEQIVPSENIVFESKTMDEDKENENKNDCERKSTPKKNMTPRRSLRLSRKLERTLSDGNLNLERSSLPSKTKSDSEDSFMRLENELNIIHDKKEKRKTICGSLRELAILQSSRSNTPATMKILRSKSILNTPRIGRSRNAMKQLQSLLTDSPV